MKIAVAGTGYVGLSIATLLAQHNEVVALDIVKEKVDMINNHISPIKDAEIEKFLKEKELNLRATLDYEDAFKKLGDLSASNVELNTQYQAALTSIQNYTTQLQEQQKQIEFLKDKLLEVEKPYKNMPKFIVHIVNWFLNLFNKNK